MQESYYSLVCISKSCSSLGRELEGGRAAAEGSCSTHGQDFISDQLWSLLWAENLVVVEVISRLRLPRQESSLHTPGLQCNVSHSNHNISVKNVSWI